MRPMVAGKRGEAVIGLLLAALGIMVAYTSGNLPAGQGSVPGPGSFPTALGVLLALAGSGLTIVAFRSEAKPGVDLLEPRALACVALIAAYALAFESVGFLPSTFAFLLLAFVAVGQVRWLPALAVSLAASAVMGLLFQRVLSIRLPSASFG